MLNNLIYERIFSHSKYRNFGIEINPIGPDKVIVNLTYSGKSIILSNFDAQLLLAIDSFDTLPIHAERFCREIKKFHLKNKRGLFGKLLRFLLSISNLEIPVKDSEVETCIQQLQGLVNLGLLVSKSELKHEIISLSNLNSKKRYQSNAKISMIGIPTCNRPEVLKRCIDSFITNFSQYKRTPQLLIIDDSRSATMQDDNKRIVEHLKEKYDSVLYYMNRQQREEFSKAIAQKGGLDPEVTKFALMGLQSNIRSEGGCRNTILLLSIGHFILQTDDDTICRIAQPPTSYADLSLTSELVSDEYWFFKSFNEASKAAKYINADFLSLHEQFLGEQIGNIINLYLNDDKKFEINKLQPSFLQKMAKEDSNVLMSSVGPIGDDCLNSSLYRLFLEGESFQRLISQPDRFSSNLTTRQAIRCVTQPTLSSKTRCIGMNFAVDNRSFLPPFMPVLYRCDGIFGDLLEKCFLGGFSVNIPYLLMHDPPEYRNRTVDEVYSLLKRVRANDLISVILTYTQDLSYNANPKSNVRFFGDFLISLSSLSQSEFNKKIQAIYTSYISRDIQLSEQRLLANKGICSNWDIHMKRYIEALNRFAVNNDSFIPVDLNQETNRNNKDLKNIISLFGRLLIYWPKIYEIMDGFSHEEKLEYMTCIK